MRKIAFHFCPCLAGFLVWSIFSVPAAGQLESGQKKQKVTEIFHVSSVGQGGAAETREVLVELYAKISGEYNQKLKREQQSNPQLFEGDRVRVLRRLDEKDENGQYYLAAYDGGPAVFAFKGERNLEPGELSPPLVINKVGEHVLEITRQVRIKQKNQPEPALEVVEENTSGVATFFGIPITGGSSSSSSSSSGSSPKKNDSPRFKTVTETQTLPNNTAAASTKRLDGGAPEMSQQLFLSQLKNGEVYSVSRPEKRRCQQCRGFKRIKTTRPVGFRDPDGKMPCPPCQAAGKIDWNVTYKVVW